MDLKKMKSTLAMAALGMSGIMSSNAMANDIDTNKVAYDGLQNVQNHVQEMNDIKVDFNNPSVQINNLNEIVPTYQEGDKPVSVASNEPEIEDKLILPISDQGDISLDSDDELKEISGTSVTAEVENTSTKVNNKIDEIEIGEQEKEQVEACNRDENEASFFKKSAGWILKGSAAVMMFKSVGTMAVPAHLLNRTGNAIMMNGCDTLDLKTEALDLGKTIISAGAKDAAMIVEFGLDYAQDKYKEKVAKDEAAAKAKAEEEKRLGIPETSVVTTSEVIPSDNSSPLVGADAQLKSIENSEPDNLSELKSLGNGEEPELKSIGADSIHIKINHEAMNDFKEPVKNTSNKLKM